MTTVQLKKEYAKLADPKRAKTNARYFKTDEGHYGAGDIFIGITVPQTRAFAKKHKDTPLEIIERLLHSDIHEERLLALIMLVNRFEKADENEQKQIYTLYLKNLAWVNNWDLVDSSAHKIVGAYMSDRPTLRKKLYTLAKSKNLWERRVAIIATYYFIGHDQFDDTIKIATLLRKDTEDLIHKAVGWMLREVGKRNQRVEEAFLKQYYKTLPRTMLRYAIEKFPEAKRKRYLSGTM